MLKIEITERGIGYCGLICDLCNVKLSGKCSGCKAKSDACEIRTCSENKNHRGCFRCETYPCGQGRFNNPKIKAINKLAGKEGPDHLVQCLQRNLEEGVTYSYTKRNSW